MVLTEAVEPEAEFVGQLDPLEGLRELVGHRDLLAGEGIRGPVAEAVDAEFHADSLASDA